MILRTSRLPSTTRNHSALAWVRLDLDWSEVQPDGPSSYQWANFDRVVSARRICAACSVLPILAYTPPWARPAEATSAQWAPADPALFAAVCCRRSAALRTPWCPYVGDLERTKYSRFWAPTPDPTAYVQLLSLAAVAHAPGRSASLPRFRRAGPYAELTTEHLATRFRREHVLPRSEPAC